MLLTARIWNYLSLRECRSEVSKVGFLAQFSPTTLLNLVKVIQPGMVYVVGDEDESPAALKQRQQEQARRASEGKGKAKETDAQDDTYPLYIIASSRLSLC